jgi:hypothetical protein
MKTERISIEDVQFLDPHCVKTRVTLCPRCSLGDKVYHILPWDYKKLCKRCRVTWQEDNI